MKWNKAVNIARTDKPMNDSKTVSVSEAVRALYMLGRLNEHEHVIRFLAEQAESYGDNKATHGALLDAIDALEHDACVRGVVE